VKALAASSRDILFRLGKDTLRVTSVGYWATVIEKAHRYLTGRTESDSGDSPAQAAMLLSGVSNNRDYSNFKQDHSRMPTNKHLRTKPGASWADDSAIYSDSELGMHIQTALSSKRIVVASTQRDGTAWVRPTAPVAGATDNMYLLPNHSYSVMSYMPARGNREAQVILRNPLGVVTTIDQDAKLHHLGGRDADGYFQVSVKDFTKLFSRLDVEG